MKKILCALILGTAILSCTKKGKDDSSSVDPREGVICTNLDESQTSPNGEGNGWTTVDDYAIVDHEMTMPVAAVMDSSGSLYVLVDAYEQFGAAEHVIIRKSSDQGATWSIIEDFFPEDSINRSTFLKPYSMVLDNLGNIFYGGSLYKGADIKSYYYLRKGDTSGSSWSTHEEFQEVSGGYGGAYQVSYNSISGKLWSTHEEFQEVSGGYGGAYQVSYNSVSGKLMAMGNPGNGADFDTVLRVSSNNGTNWSQTAIPSTMNIFRTAVAPNGDFFAIGTNQATAAPPGHWQVFKTTNDGATWTTLDDYVVGGEIFPIATSIAWNGNNTIYVSGYYADQINSHWITRKSSDAGATWATVDDFQSPDTITINPYSMLIDSAGKIYIGGMYPGSATNEPAWYVRTSTDSGATWSNENIYRRYSGCNLTYQNHVNGFYSMNLLKDSSGNVYLTGHFPDYYSHALPPNGQYQGQHSIVRKRAF